MLQVGEKKEHDEGRREVKREEVRSFAAAGAFIILSVSSNEETPPQPPVQHRPFLFLLGRFSFLIFPLSLADILKVLIIFSNA